MLQECMSIAYALVCVYYPSWPCALYLAISVFLWLKCIFFKEMSSKNIYKIGVISSIVILILKSLMILHNSLGFLLEDYFLYKDILNSFGISIDINSINIISTITPDIIAAAISFFSFYSVGKDYFY